MNYKPTREFSELAGFDSGGGGGWEEVHGTTVIALLFDGGAMMLADRRATMGNLIMYEAAEKILALDDTVVVGVSGAYARSLEVGRLLRHSFKYYERLNLTELSCEGKLTEISKALRANLPMAVEGIGLFLPIAASYDKVAKKFGVYFFDPAGARFQGSEYACAGSGSERIRGVFEYIAKSKGPWSQRAKDDVLQEGLRLLEIASDLDSATGGIRGIPPLICILDSESAVFLEESMVRNEITKMTTG